MNMRHRRERREWIENRGEGREKRKGEVREGRGEKKKMR